LLTRQFTVNVTVVNGGPQDAKLVWLRVRLILVGLLTLVLRVIGPGTSGAHLNESPALPELVVPPLPENVTLRGFVVHRLLGAMRLAKPTAA
jgi:hypothetical protein